MFFERSTSYIQLIECMSPLLNQDEIAMLNNVFTQLSFLHLFIIITLLKNFFIFIFLK